VLVVAKEYTAIAMPHALCDLGHQGLKHDDETGLIENRNRMLNPATGRFQQRDPLGYPDGMNRYAGYHVMHGGWDPWG